MIERAVEILSASRRVVTFSGAGLSAESGVPTFRDAGSRGLWSRYEPMKLASPEGFAADPETVIAWYNWRRTVLAGVEPNAAHRALAARTDMLHITQNVDDLLERAGAPADNVVHLHGSMTIDRCHRACGFVERVELASPPPRRLCPMCAAPMRPAVVWFGESLPPEAWTRAAEASGSCDAMIVIGTSAAVYPAAGLIGVARQAGASIIVINAERTDASRLADVEIIGLAGEIVPRLVSPR